MKQRDRTSSRQAQQQGGARERSQSGQGARAVAPPRYGVELADARARGEGKAVPEDVRAKMEGALGMDFSGVRVHEGPQATAMGALAYTQGTDIHFAPGQYQPHSHRGQELLGHELTHVVQQAQGRVPTPRQSKGMGINRSPILEREADELGRKAAQVSMPSHLDGLLPSPRPEAAPQQGIAQRKTDGDQEASSLFGRMLSLASAVWGFFTGTVPWTKVTTPYYSTDTTDSVVEATKVNLSVGDRFYMYLSDGQIGDQLFLGAYATPEAYTNENEVREKLAIRSDWKPDITIRVELEVKQEITVEESMVRHQWDPVAKETLIGGGWQFKGEFKKALDSDLVSVVDAVALK